MASASSTKTNTAGALLTFDFHDNGFVILFIESFYQHIPAKQILDLKANSIALIKPNLRLTHVYDVKVDEVIHIDEIITVLFTAVSVFLYNVNKEIKEADIKTHFRYSY